ncbi:YebC-like protein [Panus rudis PR-1116 ss-1]|nr:YebC-like protein [Panus rudis PR-1116 ss-1]
MNFARALTRATPICLNSMRTISTTSVALAGHNKWSKIKHKKGANDIKKGKLYSKAARDIVLAARTGGSPDPEVNATLAAAVKKARSQGVPKDNIENALKRAAGGKEKGDQPVTYEIMAAGSVGVIVECLTDNVNRTVRSIKTVLSDNGARLAPVGFLFERKGLVKVAVEDGNIGSPHMERLVDAALEAGAEDFTPSHVENNEIEVEFKCPPASLAKLTAAVTAPGMAKELLKSELVYQPIEQAEVPDEETQRKVAELVEELEENEDTLRVWTTLDYHIL